MYSNCPSEGSCLFAFEVLVLITLLPLVAHSVVESPSLDLVHLYSSGTFIACLETAGSVTGPRTWSKCLDTLANYAELFSSATVFWLPRQAVNVATYRQICQSERHRCSDVQCTTTNPPNAFYDT
ncbi:hypothetical protein F5B18DRAFT_311542 [Nemania serpens]|nr:hypothetical protein F5B18DRAFT_311542 [Nemania serpens]